MLNAMPFARPADGRPAASVRVAGALAHAALVRSRGMVFPVPGFEATPFRLAAGNLVWVGSEGPIHPRVVLLESDPSAEPGRLDVDSATVIAPGTVAAQGFSAIEWSKAGTRAILRLLELAEPAGFGVLLRGGMPQFPLSHRVSAARGLAGACRAGDLVAMSRHAMQLLGVGAGLTPSGDDFVGGALFGLHFTQTEPAWRVASAELVAHAALRTHSISLALLSDLANGESYAALHGLAAALARADTDHAAIHALELVSIGSSSGWDMLAGFMAAIAGTLDFS